VGVVGATAPLMVLLLAGCSWRTSAPIPEVPPPAGDPVPAIDTYARAVRPISCTTGSARAPALGIPVTALEAYAYAARVAEVENRNAG
jgi:hypothetical protein